MKWLLAACAALGMMLCAAPASARTLQIRYAASDAFGWEAPPSYGLRLDGVFGGDAAVTFHFNDVFFDVFDDGSAQLYGTISVAAVGGGAPGGAASTWNMNVLYQRNPSFPGNPEWEYYHLIHLGGELVNAADGNDVIDLSEAPVDGTMPFELGVGVFPNFKCTSPAPCMGGAGWLNWVHGNLSHAEGAVADFVFEVMPLEVPEPGLSGLVALALAALGLRLAALRKRGA